MNRRIFVQGSALLTARGLAQSKLPWEARKKETEEPVTPRRVSELELDLDHIHKWDDSNGDTWDPFWADDDALYSFNCDGRGFGPIGMNLALNRFDGTAPGDLKGIQINAMPDYGKSTEHGRDGATWKVCGQECIDGVFYAFVSRNIYGHESHDRFKRQTAFNSSLIKSTNRGQTWMRAAEENYKIPMWPGPLFGTPFFVHYGKNGGAPSEYVYAASNNGFWNDGDSLVLGRISRKVIANLNAEDWEYFAGAKAASLPNWTRSIEKAEPILQAAGRLGQTPICHVPKLGIYLLISWYNPVTIEKWFEPSEMRYDFYQAEHPWGPWSLITSISDRFLATGSHMYGPSLCAKFQENTVDGMRLIMFTSGCPFEDKPSGVYKAWTIPVILRTGAERTFRTLSAMDSQFHTVGNWQVERETGRTSRSRGDSIAISFDGAGIECIAGKAAGFGDVEVLLDEKSQGTISLGLKNFPSLSGVVIFRSPKLEAGRHELKLVNAGTEPVNIESVKIYGD